MKHIYEYEEQELQDLVKGLEKVGHAPMKGWIVAVVPFYPNNEIVGTTYYAITADTVEEAYALVAEDWIPEMEDPIDPKSWEDLLEKISEMLEWEMGAIFLTAWEGLVCRRKDPTFEAIRNSSPFEAIKRLDQEFTNVQSVMGASPKGNTE